jgi:hypothetical protein
MCEPGILTSAGVGLALNGVIGVVLLAGVVVINTFGKGVTHSAACACESVMRAVQRAYAEHT